MNAMPTLPKQIPCVCIMYYYMANKDDSDSDCCFDTVCLECSALTCVSWRSLPA